MPIDPNYTVQQLMSGLNTGLLGEDHPVIVATPDDPLSKAEEWFTHFDVHHLPVVSSLEERTLVGILSTIDVLKHYSARGNDGSATIGDVMVPEPVKISPSTTVAHATQLLASATYQSLPVVDADGRCVGIVTVRDLVKYFASRIDAAMKR